MGTGAPNEKGFTLVELAVTVAILAILAAVTIPSMNNFIRRGRITTAANELIGAMQSARMHAVNQRATVTLCPSADGATCSAALGTRWIVRSVKNGVGTVVREVRVPTGVTLVSSPNLSGANNAFTFRPNGFSGVGANTTGTLSACVGAIPGQNAVDITSNIGRVSSARRAGTAACSAPADG